MPDPVPGSAAQNRLGGSADDDTYKGAAAARKTTVKRFRAWRDIDSPRRVFGFTISKWVAGLYLGKRLYRIARFR